MIFNSYLYHIVNGTKIIVYSSVEHLSTFYSKMFGFTGTLGVCLSMRGVCLKVVFSYTSGSDHFLSGVDCLAASWALIGPTELLGQLGRVGVGGGLMKSSSERETMN